MMVFRCVPFRYLQDRLEEILVCKCYSDVAVSHQCETFERGDKFLE